jgi:hypothetical protein
MTNKKAIDLALKALKQERENYRLYGDEDGAPDYIHEAIKALEEAQQRTWVGLDEAQKENLVVLTGSDIEPHNLRELIDEVEAKLKEKNVCVSA